MNKHFNQNDVNKIFNSFKTFSQNDADRVLGNEGKINHIMKDSALEKFLDDVSVYFQMLKDYFSGRYKQLPLGTIAAIIGSLLYVLSPVDLIPDFIPVVGYLDDAAMLALCANLTRYDVKKYKEFKSSSLFYLEKKVICSL